MRKASNAVVKWEAGARDDYMSASRGRTRAIDESGARVGCGVNPVRISSAG
jgi:hypothetical protein